MDSAIQNQKIGSKTLMATASRAGTHDSTFKWAFVLRGMSVRLRIFYDALMARYLDCESYCSGDDCLFLCW